MKAILLLNASRQSCLIGMGNCSGNLELSCKVSALELGRGKNGKDIENRIVSTSPTVHMDGKEYVSECVQTVQCAGDCTCIQHITTPKSAKIEAKTCRKGEPQTQIKQTIPSQNNVCSARRYDKPMSDNTLFGKNILPKKSDQTETSIIACSEISDMVGANPDLFTHPYEGNILPNFYIWVNEMMEDVQTVDSNGGGSLQFKPRELE